MRELQVQGLTADGDAVLLVDASGGRFLAPATELRQALLRPVEDLSADETRPAVEPFDDPLTPKSIQTRIRAGQKSEDIAAAAGVPLAKVQRWELPVLAERAHVAEAAQGAAVRRHGDAPGVPLGQVVASRLDGVGVAPGSLEWDAWRLDDGTWRVQVAYATSAGRASAHWRYDPVRRIVSPDDDEARWLTDDHRPAPEPRRPVVPRLQAVPSVTERLRRDVVEVDEPDEADEVDEVDVLEATDEVATEDEPATEEASSRGATKVPGGEQPELPTGEDGDDGEDEPQVEETVAAARGRNRSARRRQERLTGDTDRQAVRDGVAPGRRATVPSWDEIVFGSRRRD